MDCRESKNQDLTLLLLAVDRRLRCGTGRALGEIVTKGVLSVNRLHVRQLPDRKGEIHHGS